VWVLISRDADLGTRLGALAREAGVVLETVSEHEALRRCGGEPDRLRRAFLDLNVGEEALVCCAALRGGPCNPEIIAFLDHFVGDLPIRAKLAGADRVVPRAQLLKELAHRPSPPDPA
jgi:hypothetical protein